MTKLAPIALFVYNRPWHTQQTIEALQKNDLASMSDLIIFSDSQKDQESLEMVKEVRKYLKTISGFNSVRIIERGKNWGLAKSITEGVSEIVNLYGKIIVLEDDIVTSSKFLRFMNQALDFYKDKREVWHISGWNYPIDSSHLSDTFLWRAMNCWGWATWDDRWEFFDKDPQLLVDQWTDKQKLTFDLDDLGIFWNQIELNLCGKINTWAIFWYATIFKNDGLCLNPSISYVENIGHDDSGVHCGSSNKFSTIGLNEKLTVSFPKQSIESSIAVSLIKKFYRAQKKSVLARILDKIQRAFF